MIDRRRWIPTICLCLPLLAANVFAQAINPQDDAFGFSNPGNMPHWTVPVLRLVSSTHVEPTTGIVISSDGLVLVPDDFSSTGDEIIVLDGGTDIIRNGRPARLEQRFPGAGLKALRVDGLDRRGAPFADRIPADGANLRLVAYPPAERIAEGDPPVQVDAPVVVAGETGQPALARQGSLPNVTGALMDSCGNLVGVSIAADIQTLEPSPATRYQWPSSLREILSALGVAPSPSLCPSAETDTAPEPEPDEVPPPEPEKTPEPLPEEEPAPEEDFGETSPESEEAVAEEEEIPWDILPPIETGDVSQEVVQPAEDDGASKRNWLWLAGAAVLFALGLLIHRIRRRRTADEAPTVTSPEQPDERAPEPPPGEPESTPEPAGLDSRLQLTGTLPGGQAFEISCPVSAEAINVVIGRGEADLRIDSVAISRHHARLNGSADRLTVTDLGSNNGTSVNGVPCLEDEVFFITPEDILILGDVRLQVRVAPADGDGS